MMRSWIDVATDRTIGIVAVQARQLPAIGIVLLMLAVVGVLVGCSKPPSPAPSLADANPAVITSPNDSREYDLIELGNGLEVMLVSDPTAEKSAAALSVGLGASSDPIDYPGMAHYLEHMLFMGSAQFPEPDGFMAFTAEHGGMTNAYTGLDITNYMMIVENEAFPGPLIDSPASSPTRCSTRLTSIKRRMRLMRSGRCGASRISASPIACRESYWVTTRRTAFRSVTSNHSRIKLRGDCTQPPWRFLNSITALT